MVDPVHDRVADGAVMRWVGIQSLIPIGIRIILRTEYCCAVFGSSFNDLEQIIGLLKSKRSHQPFVQNQQIHFTIRLDRFLEIVFRAGER